ncbi:MAG: hypothetical protein LC687_06045, partial [Actinobacteria bacterium]|nr:hypothetical protein [Actinomycetota bacterium]
SVEAVEAINSESPDNVKDAAKWQKHWEKELKAFKKRCEKFLRQGNTVVDRYLDEGTKEHEGLNDYRLNFFHTNITTLQSMLYGSVPKMEVDREQGDPDDDVARVASVIILRILELDLQDNEEDLPTILKQCLQDRLLPGLGNARIRYKHKMAEDGTLDYEEVCEEYVHWQDFAWGWARTWNSVPWNGFRSYLSEDEVKERFGDKIADKLTFKNQKISQSDESKDSDEDKEVEQKAEIWEFWNKEDRRVYWFAEGVPYILDIQDDPMQLSGFYPCPRPLLANLTAREFMPKADFMMAQDLYNEIDVLQTRISKITRAVKVVGVYEKGNEGVSRMFQEGTENELIPVDSWAAFSEKGGLAGAIDWMPIADIAAVLDKLRGELNSNIEMLYQITGMSDILRGANTDQYTSDGTNQLKAKFGSIRVQALQDEFARFASNLAGLKAEAVGKHYEPMTIFKASNAEYLPTADRDKIIPAISLIKSPDIMWRVNIRPESVAMVDYAQLKAERTEYLTAVATFLQSANSMVTAMPDSLPVLMEMLKWGMAGFKGSNYLEGIMDQAIEAAKNTPPPGQDDGAAQAEMQKMQMEQQAEMQKIQAKLQADMQLNQAKAQSSIKEEAMQHQFKMQEEQMKSSAELQKTIESMKAELAVIQAKLQADVQIQGAEAEGAAIESRVDYEHELSKSAVEHELEMDRIAEEAKNAKVETKSNNT